LVCSVAALGLRVTRRVNYRALNDIELSASNTSAHVAVKNRSKGRSRVTKGSQFLPLAGGRSTSARRFRDLYEQIAADLGGLDHLSEGQKQLIFMAPPATARLLQRLGLSRLAKDVSSVDRGLDVIMERVNKLNEDEAPLREDGADG
jgi:hypothetical protein